MFYSRCFLLRYQLFGDGVCVGGGGVLFVLRGSAVANGARCERTWTLTRCWHHVSGLNQHWWFCRTHRSVEAEETTVTLIQTSLMKPFSAMISATFNVTRSKTCLFFSRLFSRNRLCLHLSLYICQKNSFHGGLPQIHHRQRCFVSLHREKRWVHYKVWVWEVFLCVCSVGSTSGGAGDDMPPLLPQLTLTVRG